MAKLPIISKDPPEQKEEIRKVTVRTPGGSEGQTEAASVMA